MSRAPIVPASTSGPIAASALRTAVTAPVSTRGMPHGSADRADQLGPVRAGKRHRPRIAQAPEEQRAGLVVARIEQPLRARERGFEIAARDGGLREVDGCGRQSGLERERAPEARRGFAQFVAREQRRTQIVVRLGMVRIAFKCLAVPADRLVAQALRAERVAEVHIGRRESGLEGQRALVPLGGFRSFAHCHQHGAEIVVRLGIVGP